MLRGVARGVDTRTNKRIGTAAAGYYDGITREASGVCPAIETGDSNTKGWVRTFSCTVKLERSAYLSPPEAEGVRKTVGWPKDGTVYVTATYDPRFEAS